MPFVFRSLSEGVGAIDPINCAHASAYRMLPPPSTPLPLCFWARILLCNATIRVRPSAGNTANNNGGVFFPYYNGTWHQISFRTAWHTFAQVLSDTSVRLPRNTTVRGVG